MNSMEPFFNDVVYGRKVRYKLDPERAVKLKKAICAVYGVTEDELMKRRRFQRFVKPRQMFFYIAFEKWNVHEKAIADFFRLDRTSVLHGAGLTKGFFHIHDPEILEKYELVTEYLKSKT